MAKTEKLKTVPRKLAKQARAEAMIDALLTATARILVREGYAGCSTNRIASEAGASIGSLYQYFPSKEAIILAVVERHMQADAREVLETLGKIDDLTVPKATREIVACLVRMHLKNRALRRALMEQVPKIGGLEKIRRQDQEIGEVIFDRLTRGNTRIKLRNRGILIFTLTRSLTAVIYGATYRRAELLDREELTDELTRLVLSYLGTAAA